MSKISQGAYHYTECGLDDVYLLSLPVAKDRAGESTLTIQNINGLHSLLRCEVALKEVGLNSKEIRFLRTALGYSQTQLAKVLHKDGQTVGRWERGETLIDGTSETLLRALVLEETSIVIPIPELALRAIQSPKPHRYNIDASNPDNYRLAA